MSGADEKACVIACAEEIVHVSESTSVIVTWSMPEVDKSALEKTAEALLHETAELIEVTMEPNVVLTMVEETIGVLTMVDAAVETADIRVQVEADWSRAKVSDTEVVDVVELDVIS